MLSENSFVLHYLCQRLHIQTPEEREAENIGKEDISKRDRKKIMVSSHSCSVRQTQGWRGSRVEPGAPLSKAWPCSGSPVCYLGSGGSCVGKAKGAKETVDVLRRVPAGIGWQEASWVLFPPGCKKSRPFLTSP